MDAWQDAEVDAVAVGTNNDPMEEAVHRCPYHMFEVLSVVQAWVGQKLLKSNKSKRFLDDQLQVFNATFEET